MPLLYKLTDQQNQTPIPFCYCKQAFSLEAARDKKLQWGPNVTHTITSKNPDCGPDQIRTFAHPLTAMFLAPLSLQTSFDQPRLWTAEGTISLDNTGLVIGCSNLTTLEEIPLPEISSNQRIAFAILCAREAETSPEWRRWADSWLSGEDRAYTSATGATTDASAYASSAAFVTSSRPALGAIFAAHYAACAAGTASVTDSPYLTPFPTPTPIYCTGAYAAAAAALCASYHSAFDLIAVAKNAMLYE
jgi:hypothetical protein